jgi:hypothetical protein
VGPVMGRGGGGRGHESRGVSHRLGPVMKMMSQWVQS